MPKTLEESIASSVQMDYRLLYNCAVNHFAEGHRVYCTLDSPFSKHNRMTLTYAEAFCAYVDKESCGQATVAIENNWKIPFCSQTYYVNVTYRQGRQVQVTIQ